MSDFEWKALANCRGINADLFYPVRGESAEPAKAVCRGCEVSIDCLEYALTSGEKVGIWGGMSERERRRIRHERGRRVLECGTFAGYGLHLRKGEMACEDCREAARVRSAAARGRRLLSGVVDGDFADPDQRDQKWRMAQ